MFRKSALTVFVALIIGCSKASISQNQKAENNSKDTAQTKEAEFPQGATKAESEHANEVLKKIAGLAGHWEGKSISPKSEAKSEKDQKKNGRMETFALDMEVTSGGHSVSERLMPGTPHEMLSVYHVDGPTVLMTHYCMIGNQPRMALKSEEGNTLSFNFRDATNLGSPLNPHIHDLKLVMLDSNHFRQEWTFFENGAAKGTEVFEFQRKAVQKAKAVKAK